jgi:hypothetical protein
VTGEWRKLHNGELHNLYSSPDIIRQIKSRRMSWAGHVACMGEGRNLYRVLVGKPEGKSPLVRPKRRGEDGIKMDFREIGWGGVEWIHLSQDRDCWRVLVNAVMNLWFLAPRSYLYFQSVTDLKELTDNIIVGQRTYCMSKATRRFAPNKIQNQNIKFRVTCSQHIFKFCSSKRTCRK